MFRITITQIDSQGKESWFSFDCNRPLDEKDGATLAWLSSLNFRVSVTNLSYQPKK